MIASTSNALTPGVLADVFAENLRAKGVLRVLQAVRKNLGMNVAFLSHFREFDRVMQHVDSDGHTSMFNGMETPLEHGYCLKVARGELPELIPDTSCVPAALAIPETASLSIGAHLSVPIQMQGGQLYGTLCCFSHQPKPSLCDRDLQVLRAFADVLATQIEETAATSQAAALKVNAVRRVIQNAPRIVYQPIYSLHTGALRGMECLSRFDGEDPRSPSQWFALAGEVGLRGELEAAAIRKALRGIDNFSPSIFLALNSSPQTILDGSLREALRGTDLRRLVIEITEHSMVEDYLPLEAALRPLRQGGMRIAVDDAGAGYASMRHILNLKPEFIKLDGSLTAGIDKDPAQRALVRAMASFAREIRSSLIAEGIETRSELELLQGLGIETGQGFLLQEPLSIDVACRPEINLCRIRSTAQHLPM